MIKVMLMADFTESFSYELLKGILEYSRRDKSIIVFRIPLSYKYDKGIDSVLKKAVEWGVDAIIGKFDDDNEIEIFENYNIAVVAQDHKSFLFGVPSITSDYIETGNIAAKYFIKKGFHHFAFYGLENVMWSEKRKQGFFEKIKEKKYKSYSYLESLEEHTWSYNSHNLLSWLNSLPKPIAIMACDDTMGNRIIEICRANKIRIPEEISVLGVDNDEVMCNLSYPPLSSIRLNISQAGFETATLIDTIIQGKGSAKNQNIFVKSTGIVNRLSTDFYSTDNPHIMKALRYIHQNFSKKISVSDVVSQVPLSRRLLEIRFRQITQQSVYRYIADLRIEKFSELLIISDSPISELAVQVGISDFKNLSRQFKHLKGKSPSQYRNEYRISL